MAHQVVGSRRTARLESLFSFAPQSTVSQQPSMHRMLPLWPMPQGGERWRLWLHRGMCLRPDPQANMQPSALAHWPIPHWGGVFRYPCRCGAPIKPSGLIPIRNYSGCAPMMHIPADYKTQVHRPPCQRKSRSAHMTLARPTRWSPANGAASKLIQRNGEPRGERIRFVFRRLPAHIRIGPAPQTPQASEPKCKGACLV